MWKATLRGVLARKVRLALSAMAVVLGVAFVSGTFVLTDTLQRTFDDIFARTQVGVDLVVRSPVGFDGAPTSRTRMPASITERVRGVDGVADAVGVLSGYAQLVDADGDAVSSGGAPTLGVSWGFEGNLGVLHVVEGREPEAEGEIALDAGTAAEEGFALGDTVRVLTTGAAEEFTVVGTFGFGDVTDFGGVTFSAFDSGTAQRVFDAPSLVDWVSVVAADDGDVEALREQLTFELPGYEVVDAETFTDELGEPVREGLALINAVILAFAAVGVFVGAFIILNTFMILVTERTRELGLLRALGASPGQVRASVLAEAAVVGVVGSVVGLGAGLVLATALLRAVGAFGLDVPAGDTIVAPRTVAAALVVGVVVTVLAAWPPARRATRVPAVAALADLRPGAPLPLRRRALVGTAIMVVGGAVLVGGLGRGPEAVTPRVAIVGLGALVTFVGLAVVTPVLVVPLGRLVGAPLARFSGVAGVLARGNALRNPRRTAATAAALVIGIGLMGLVAIFAASLQTSIQVGLDESVRADYVLSAAQLAGFSTEVAEEVRELPEVEVAVPMRFASAQVGDRVRPVAGVGIPGVTQVLDLGIEGDAEAALAELDPGGVLVHDDEARELGVGPGDGLPVALSRSGRQDLVVAGTYRNAQFVGALEVPFVLSLGGFEAGLSGTQQDTLVYVAAAPGETIPARVAMDDLLGDRFPNVRVQTRQQYGADQERAVDTLLAVTIALLLFSEVIAVLGIVNTLALSVFERTRELGLLRVVGMSGRQVRSMVRGESVIVAVIGGLLGVAVGLLWGWAMTTALRSEGVTELAVPVLWLVAFVAFAVLAGIVAAVVPAWRAARLDVLDAIAQE